MAAQVTALLEYLDKQLQQKNKVTELLSLAEEKNWSKKALPCRRWNWGSCLVVGFWIWSSTVV